MSAKSMHTESEIETEHQGMVQLGDLCALATWTEVEVLRIRFSLATLGRDQLRLVSQLKLNAHPVYLKLDGKRLKGS
jgi:hypothetical protein